MKAREAEALIRACQARGRVWDEGTGRCCQYRTCKGRDHHGPCARVRGTSRGGLQSTGETQSGEEGEVPMQSAVVGVDKVVVDEMIVGGKTPGRVKD